MPDALSSTQSRNVSRNEQNDEPACRPEPKAKELARSSLDIAWDDHTPSGGMSSHAGASRLGREVATSISPTKDQMAQQAAAVQTRAIDHPLEDDPIGNALVGVVAAGFAGGVEAAASGVTATGARIAGAGAKHAAEHVVVDVVKHGATEAVEHMAEPTHEYMGEGSEEAKPAHASALPPARVSSPSSPSAAAAASTTSHVATDSAGQSSKSGASILVREETGRSPAPALCLPPIPYAIRG